MTAQEQYLRYQQLYHMHRQQWDAIHQRLQQYQPQDTIAPLDRLTSAELFKLPKSTLLALKSGSISEEHLDEVRLLIGKRYL